MKGNDIMKKLLILTMAVIGLLSFSLLNAQEMVIMKQVDDQAVFDTITELPYAIDVNLGAAMTEDRASAKGFFEITFMRKVSNSIALGTGFSYWQMQLRGDPEATEESYAAAPVLEYKFTDNIMIHVSAPIERYDIENDPEKAKTYLTEQGSLVFLWPLNSEKSLHLGGTAGLRYNPSLSRSEAYLTLKLRMHLFSR